MTAAELIAADAALEARCAPLLFGWDDCVFQSDALAGLFDRDDHSDLAETVRTTRLRLSEAAQALELAMHHARTQIAAARNVPEEHMVTVDALIRRGKRAA